VETPSTSKDRSTEFTASDVVGPTHVTSCSRSTSFISTDVLPQPSAPAAAMLTIRREVIGRRLTVASQVFADSLYALQHADHKLNALDGVEISGGSSPSLAQLRRTDVARNLQKRCITAPRSHARGTPIARRNSRMENVVTVSLNFGPWSVQKVRRMAWNQVRGSISRLQIQARWNFLSLCP